MNIFIVPIAALVGSALSSFLFLAVYRLEKRSGYRSIINGRSYCDSCNEKLRWYELMPIFSYLIQKGRCRRCNASVPSSYWLGEVVFALGFGFIYSSQGTAIDYILFSILGFLAFYDYVAKGIPKVITNSLLLVGLVYRIVTVLIERYEGVTSLFIGLLIATLFYITVNKVKKSFGLGDLLVFVLLFLTASIEVVIMTFFFSILIGGGFSIVMVIFGKISRKSYIPFVPFIFLAYPLSLVWGEKIVSYFASILLLW